MAQITGSHPRKHQADAGKIYVAGIDLAGEAETAEDDYLTVTQMRQDSTVVTIGELDFSQCNEMQKQPRILITEHYRWTGKKHTDLYPQLVDILKNIWHCRRALVDATGVGEPVAAFLKQALGSRVIAFKFTAASKSELGFSLLAAINAGRLKMYTGDGSAEYREFCFEMEAAKSYFRANRTMNFFVDQSRGHDDFLMSTALLTEAASRYEPREAKGN